jgi:hypothetical protein
MSKKDHLIFFFQRYKVGSAPRLGAMRISKTPWFSIVYSVILLVYYVETYEICTMENQTAFYENLSTVSLPKSVENTVRIF